MKASYSFIIVLFLCGLCHSYASAKEVTVEWGKVGGATGYKIQFSSDVGATWVDVPSFVPVEFTDCGEFFMKTTFTIPDNVLVLVRSGAYNAVSEAWRNGNGTWFHSGWPSLAAPDQMSGYVAIPAPAGTTP